MTTNLKQSGGRWWNCIAEQLEPVALWSGDHELLAKSAEPLSEPASSPVVHCVIDSSADGAVSSPAGETGCGVLGILQLNKEQEALFFYSIWLCGNLQARCIKNSA